MFKTPNLGPVMAAMLLAGATAGFAAPIPGGGAMTRDHARTTVEGLNAWDGRRLDPAGITSVGEADLDASLAAPSWDESAAAPDRYTASGGEYAGASKLANLSPDAETDVLPLAQVEASHAKPAAPHSRGVWGFVNRVRYGRLPEPASWALLLIGFGMIGGALRGFVVANRRLARLQPEDGE